MFEFLEVRGFLIVFLNLKINFLLIFCIFNKNLDYNYPYGKCLSLLDYTKKCNTSASP